jgi:hypothetical protein
MQRLDLAPHRHSKIGGRSRRDQSENVVMKRSRVWLGANVLMMLMFLLAAIAQYNDPDPIPWIVIYTLASVACALELTGRSRWIVPGMIAAAAGVWAALHAPGALAHDVRMADLFTDARMMNPGVEEARETIGLLLVAAWMAGLAWAARRRARRAQFDPSALSRSIR